MDETTYELRPMAEAVARYEELTGEAWPGKNGAEP